MEIDCNSDMDDNIDEIVSIVESSNGSDGREADAIISGKIEKSTRNLYAKKNAVLLRWLQDKYPLHVREDNSIIVPLPVDIVKKYFAHVTKKKNGKNCAYSTVAGFKSAMQDLYSSHGCEDAFPAKLASDFFKGYKRKVANLVLNGEMNLGEGKMFLSYKGYGELLKLALRDSTTQRHGLFPNLYILLSWNLMCRTVSTGSLLYTHITWMEDALVIHLPKHKGDPTGSKSFQKHVYANVYDPLRCPILGLAVRVLCECNNGVQKVLGDNAPFKFSTWLLSILKKLDDDQLCAMLIERGTVNTHSFRKGAPVFTLSCLFAIKLACNYRMGKALPANDDPYFFPEPGRIFCGLPTCDDRFSTLPPHFKDPAVLESVDIGGNISWLCQLSSML